MAAGWILMTLGRSRTGEASQRVRGLCGMYVPQWRLVRKMWRALLLALAFAPGVHLMAGASSPRIVLGEQTAPVLLKWPDGRETALRAYAELGCRPFSRWVKVCRLTRRRRLPDGVVGQFEVDGDYELLVRVQHYHGGIRLQSLLCNRRGVGEPAYYYWSWPLPRLIKRPAHWGDEVETFHPPDGWGHGGFHDWYWLDYGGWGLGLVTPMYLLTGGARYGRQCYLKPFPIEMQFLTAGGPGLEQQFFVFRADSPEATSAVYRRFISRQDAFEVTWPRLPRAFRRAPDWLRRTVVFQGWYYPWGEGTIPWRVKGFGLVIGAPMNARLIDLAHKAGSHVAVYVNFMQQWVPKPVKPRGYDRPLFEFTRLLDIAGHPRWQRVDREGRTARSETDWFTEFRPCFLAPGYVEKCLEALEQVLAVAPDAIFIDNVFLRMNACSGARLGKHEHRADYPNDMAAYRGLVERAAARAHSMGVAVLCNSEVDPGLWEFVDGQMYECMWYCPGWKKREKGWVQMRYAGERWAEAVRRGGTIQMLHYLGVEAPDRRLQALLFTYAWCRLYGLMWSDWYNLTDSKDQTVRRVVRSLYRLDLGPATDARAQMTAGCLWGRFARGLVVLNPLRRPARLALPAAPGPLADLVTGRTAVATGSTCTVSIGPQQARILVAAPSD